MEKGRLEDTLEDLYFLLDSLSRDKYPRFSRVVERRIREVEIALRVSLEIEIRGEKFIPLPYTLEIL